MWSTTEPKEEPEQVKTKFIQQALAACADLDSNKSKVHFSHVSFTLNISKNLQLPPMIHFFDCTGDFSPVEPNYNVETIYIFSELRSEQQLNVDWSKFPNLKCVFLQNQHLIPNLDACSQLQEFYIIYPKIMEVPSWVVDHPNLNMYTGNLYCTKGTQFASPNIVLDCPIKDIQGNITNKFVSVTSKFNKRHRVE